MSKKQAREELESDPLLETFSKAQSFYDQNKSSVIGGIIALILIIGGGIGYYYYSTSQEESAQQLFSEATTYYINGNYQQALTGSDEDFAVGFEQIIDNYPRTDAANLARYYAAVSAYNLGNLQEAISYIEDYELPDGILGVGPISFHAMLMGEAENYSEAAELYIKAAEWDENSSTTPFNYLKAAQAYNSAGEKEQAKEYAQLVVDEYSNSPQASDAQRLLGTLATANQ